MSCRTRAVACAGLPSHFLPPASGTAMLSTPISDQVAQPLELLTSEAQDYPLPPAVRLPEYRHDLPLELRAAEVRRLAISVFSQTSCWVTLYRLILGTDGVARDLYPTAAEHRHWESTDEFFEIHEMITALRGDDDQKSGYAEPLRMITIRLPVSLHESLKTEAAERETSINKLCLSKLLLGIEERFVPQEKGKVPGRKPGPQGKRIPR